MQNSFFFPQDALDQWVVDEAIDVRDGELTVLGKGPEKAARRYRLVEAVRVVRNVSSEEDPGELIGRVKRRAALEQLGAEIVETSMLLGDAAFDVQPGWIGVPAEAPPAASAGSPGGRRSKTDEEILAELLVPGP